MLEPCQQCLWRQNFHPGRGQLNGKRQAIESAADGRDRGDVLRRHDEIGLAGLCPLHEEGDRRNSGDLGERLHWRGHR